MFGERHTNFPGCISSDDDDSSSRARNSRGKTDRGKDLACDSKGDLATSKVQFEGVQDVEDDGDETVAVEAAQPVMESVVDCSKQRGVRGKRSRSVRSPQPRSTRPGRRQRCLSSAPGQSGWRY